MSYRDEKGRVYMVMPAMRDGTEQFTTMCREPGHMWMTKSEETVWRRTYYAAQKDLDELAERKGWTAI